MLQQHGFATPASGAELGNAEQASCKLRLSCRIQLGIKVPGLGILRLIVPSKPFGCRLASSGFGAVPLPLQKWLLAM